MNRERDLDVAAHAPRRAHRPSKRHRKLPHRLRVIEQGTRARLAHARRAHKFEYNRDDRHAPSVRHAHERTSRGERRCPYPRRRDEESVRARPMGGVRGHAASLGACKQQRSSSLHMPRPRAQIAEPPANGPSAWEEVRAHTDDNGRFDREGALQLERNRTERSRPRACERCARPPCTWGLARWSTKRSRVWTPIGCPNLSLSPCASAKVDTRRAAPATKTYLRPIAACCRRRRARATAPMNSTSSQIRPLVHSTNPAFH